MEDLQSTSFSPIINDPVESTSGLTINDLNKYLPALQTVDDIIMNADSMKEGIFWTEGLKGLKKIPEKSIDLIITEPPKEPWINLDDRAEQLTLQEFYDWNHEWLLEANRVLKNTGGIYLLCDWSRSNMYNGLLNEKFIIFIYNMFCKQSTLHYAVSTTTNVHLIIDCWPVVYVGMLKDCRGLLVK